MLNNFLLTILLVTILSLLDYYLTLKGFALSKLAYSKYFKLEEYELNPHFQDNINAGKYNPSHLLSVVLVAVVLYVSFYFSSVGTAPLDIRVYQFLQGIFLSIFILINSRHLANILTFRALIKNPSLVSGQVTISYEFGLLNFNHQNIGEIFVLGIIFILDPSAITLGFVAGPVLFWIISKQWLKKYKSKSK